MKQKIVFMLKRNIAFMLCMVMIMTIISVVPDNTLAAANGSKTEYDEARDVFCALVEAYYILAVEKESKVLTSVDIAEKIPCYETYSGTIREYSSVAYYPVIVEGEWIATITLWRDPVTNEYVGSIGEEYIEEYSKNTTGKNVKAAVLLASDGNYLVVNSKMIKGSEADGQFAYRTSSDEVSMAQIAKFGSFESIATVDINTAGVQRSATAYPATHSLWVPSVTQPSNKSCWAASLRSAMLYYGVSKTISQIRTALFGSNTDSMASTAQAASVAQSFGFTTGSYGSSTAPFYSLTLSRVQTETYTCGAPIFAGFKYSGGSYGHAVVVHGYSATTASPTITYMDPASGTYKASTAVSSGAITYTNSSGSTLTFAAGFAIYD